MDKKTLDIFIKDLCPRLPYGVEVEVERHRNHKVDNIRLDFENAFYFIDSLEKKDSVRMKLRPMDSMTEKEKKEFDDFCVIDEDAWLENGISGFKNQARIMSGGIDWLLKNGFDFWFHNGKSMIDLGLAVEIEK